MDRFAGRVVFVTGGSQGMGASHVRGFHSEGAKVVIADVLDEPGRALARQLGERALYVHLDVADEPSWSRAVDTAVRVFGSIDVLVNNAGILRYGSVESHSVKEFRDVINVNLVGQFLGLHTVLPLMRERGGGAVVNIGSTAAMQGNPDGIAYGVSKWGVRGLTKGAAVDMAGTGVRINSVHPGFVRTPLSAETAEAAASGQAIARFSEPDEITRVVLFAASDDAGYCTGSDFVVDGGMTAGRVGSFRDA